MITLMKHHRPCLLFWLWLLGGSAFGLTTLQAQNNAGTPNVTDSILQTPKSIDTTFDFNIHRATLEEFVKQLENLTGYSFIYGENTRLKHPVTLNMQQTNLKQLLKKAFEQEEITFEISGWHILLQKVQGNAFTASRKRFTVSGYITDKESAETLIGANVIESKSLAGTASNPFGFYSFTLPRGKAGLSFSYLGYRTKSAHLDLQKDTVLNIQLVPDNQQLKDVIVLSGKQDVGFRATTMSAVELPMTQIRNTPTLLGEADVLKTIQLMPGVQAGMEGFSGLYVRGGGPDQNLILLDGIPVYNADHLLGVFSIFTPEAVKKVTLFKGSFPSRFGGRLSSVVDIRTNDGNMKTYHGTLSIGLLTSKVHLEGPIIKDRTSFCVTARRTYPDLFAPLFMEDDRKYNYYFYDINAKVNHRFSDRSRLFLGLYHGKDHYDFENEQGYDYTESREERTYTFNNKMLINWGNTIAAARWNYVFGNKLFSNTTLAYNQYRMTTDGGLKEFRTGSEYLKEYTYNSAYRSGIKDLSLCTDFDYTPAPSHHIKAGAAYLFHTFQPEIMTSRVIETENGTAGQDTTYNSTTNSHIHGHEFLAYAEDNFSLGPRLSINAGVHLSLFHTEGKGYFSFQPRLSVRWQTEEDFALKASFTQMTQYVHLLSSSPIALPTDLWVPVTRQVRPMRSDQYAFGGYYTGWKGWEISLEAYYKEMKNVLEYQDGASFIGSSTNWQDKVEMGHGRSMGIELLIQKNTGNTTGWLSYTLAKSDRIFKDGSINHGERFPYKYDRRHNLSLCVNHRFNERIDVGGSWVFTTGGTATLAEGRMAALNPDYSNTEEVPYIPHRNNYRLPSSHRLNIGINFTKKTKHGIRIWNVSLYNVYNAMNPNLIYLEREEIVRELPNSPEGEPCYENETKYHLKKQTLLPCIPSITYTYKF